MHLLNIFLIILILVFNISCTSTLSRNDPKREVLEQIAKNLGQHNYNEAKELLEKLGAPDDVLKFEAFYSLDSTNNRKTVESTPAQMNKFISLLLEAQKIIDANCSPESVYITNEAKAGNWESKESNAVALSRKCYGSDKRFQTQRDEAYKVFSNNSNNDSFGPIPIRKCGIQQNIGFPKVAQVPKTIFGCLLETRVIEMDEKHELALKQDSQNAESKRQEIKAVEAIQKVKDDSDGTTLINLYCQSLHIIKSTNETIDHEKKIAREVGMIDKNVLYEAGLTLVNFKERAKQQEEAYRKLVGKKLSSNACK